MARKSFEISAANMMPRASDPYCRYRTHVRYISKSYCCVIHRFLLCATSSIIMSAEGQDRSACDHEDSPANKRMKTTIGNAEEGEELPDQIFEFIWSFARFDELLNVRGSSQSFKTMADRVLVNRATNAIPKSVQFSFFSRKVKIRIQRGWTEEFSSLDGVIDYAMNVGNPLNFLRGRMVHFYKERLRESGESAGTEFDDDDFGGSLSWMRKVEHVPSMGHTTAIERLGKEFQGIDKSHKLKFDQQRSMYVFDRSDEDVRSEQEGEAERIRITKIICFSLLLASDNEQVVVSFVDCKDYLQPSFKEDEKSLLVFQLSNDVEICIEHSKYEDTNACWDY